VTNSDEERATDSGSPALLMIRGRTRSIGS
jgi:hypothetical protein